MFDDVWWRYAWCGSLLGVYLAVSVVARRRATLDARPDVLVTVPIRILNALTMLAFYWLIRTEGHAVWSGWGNLLGVGLALGAVGFRWAVRHRRGGLWNPATVARLLFEAALPLAMGVFWGWLVLTAPACLLAAYEARRQARVAPARA